MLASVPALAVLAATYTPSGGSSPTEVRGEGAPRACYPAAPSASFEVTGPANVDVVLWVDLPDKPAKPAPMSVDVDVDGKGKPHKLKPKRAKGASYASGDKKKPSLANAPVRVRVGPGKHPVVVTFPKGRSGCVALQGVALATEAPPAVASSEPVAAPPASAPSDPEPVAKSATSPPLEPLVAEAPAPTTPEVIVAKPAGEPQALTEEVTPVSTVSNRQDAALRLGVGVGGALPRGNLKPGFAFGLLGELPLDPFGLGQGWSLAGIPLDLAAQLGASITPLRQQETAIIEGQGRADVIQNSLLFVFDAGGVLRASLSDAFSIYGVAGLALGVSRTEIKAFSARSTTRNDLSLGPVLAAGARYSGGPGQLFAELRYRELGTDVGDFAGVAEDTLSGANLLLGYLFEL